MGCSSLFEFVTVRSSSNPIIPQRRAEDVTRWALLDLSTLEELDVLGVAKVPRVHGAEAPGEPLAAALN